jgi:Ca2+-binding RTX toxin-like protein
VASSYLEALEPRTLFIVVHLPDIPDPLAQVNAGISSRQLIVLGGVGDHYIFITRGPSSSEPAGFFVHANSNPSLSQFEFPAAMIDRIYVEAGAGDDHVIIDRSVDIPVWVMGGDGDDTLQGGQGDGWLIGEAGNDDIYGGGGNDVVHAGAGNDVVHGEDGNDTILGLKGHDVLAGGWGQDHIDGGLGEDHLTGDDSNDFLEGGDDNDILDGGAGTDTLYGGDGNDYLLGGRGLGDSMRGGLGNDKFRADDILGNADSMWGEAGFDVLVSNSDADDLFVRGPQTR